MCKKNLFILIGLNMVFTCVSVVNSQTYKDDSLTVRTILDANSFQTITVDSVTDTSQGRITTLDFSNKRTITNIAGVGKLTQLEKLDLNFNKISNLPSEIGNLKKLKYLNCENNYINGIDEWIGELTELEYLKFSFPSTIDSLPSTIGDLSSLGGLDLGGNLLTTLPDEIVKLDLYDPMARLYINYNHIDPTKLKPEITAWINKYSLAGWEKTQILTGISLQNDYSNKAFVISLNRQSLKINFNIVGKKHLRIDLFNIKGALIAKIADEMVSEGVYSSPLNNYKLGSGIYIIRGNLEGQNFVKPINYIN